jgi:15-cis-phytoene synthase
VAAVYAWCRTCDDAIDGAPRAEQPAALGRLRATLATIYAGDDQSTPAAACLQVVVRECGIPQRYPTELLDGMAMDVGGTSYRTLDDLVRYAHRVAGTVGLMLCHVMRVRDPSALPHADDLGIAMQLTNVCRDVAEDWALGRLYLPASLLGGGTAVLLRARLGHAFPATAVPAVHSAVGGILAEAECRYRSADAGLQYLDRRSRLAVRTARLIYAAIGTEIARRDYDVLGGRVVVPGMTKLRLALRALGAATPREAA